MATKSGLKGAIEACKDIKEHFLEREINVERASERERERQRESCVCTCIYAHGCVGLIYLSRYSSIRASGTQNQSGSTSCDLQHHYEGSWPFISLRP